MDLDQLIDAAIELRKTLAGDTQVVFRNGWASEGSTVLSLHTIGTCFGEDLRGEVSFQDEDGNLAEDPNETFVSLGSYSSK